MPLDRIQCADLAGWTDEAQQSGWRRVLASIVELAGSHAAAATAVAAEAPPPDRPSIGEYQPKLHSALTGAL